MNKIGTLSELINCECNDTVETGSVEQFLMSINTDMIRTKTGNKRYWVTTLTFGLVLSELMPDIKLYFFEWYDGDEKDWGGWYLMNGKLYDKHDIEYKMHPDAVIYYNHCQLYFNGSVD